MLSHLKILNVRITNETGDKVLEYLYRRLANPQKKTSIITPNPEMLVYASRHLAYQEKLNRAEIALPDGIGLFFASSFMGDRLMDRITGVDFIEMLCAASAEKPLSMGFLGGKHGIAEKAVECLKKKYPWIKVVFAGEKLPSSSQEVKKTLGLKNEEMLDILFVAYGVPKQEEWIFENLEKLPVKAAMGVGGAFDFLSGTIPRAPFIIRYAGFEWLFRLIVQPWRWKRQLSLIEFVSLVFKQKFSAK